MSTYKHKKESPEAKAKMYWAIGIVIAVLVVILLVWNSGIFTKNATAATVGDQEYSVAEFNYYYKAVENSTSQMASQYAQYGIDYGYDPSVTASEQFFNEEEGTTYADYFAETALNNLQQISVLCSEAKAAGFEMTDAGQARIDQNMAGLTSYSLQSGYSEEAYLKMVYGPYMSKSIFEKVLMDSVIAEEYAAEKSASFEYSAQDIEAYYQDNKSALDSYDYRFVYINYSVEEKTDADGNPVDATDEEVNAAMEEASAKADSMIADVQSGTPFNEAAIPYLDETVSESYQDPEYNHYTDMAGSSLSPNIAEWLMDDGRASGDITSVKVDNVGYCVVQFLGRDKGDDVYQTMNYRNILVLAETTENEDGTAAPTEDQLNAARDQADALLAQWQSDGATADAFAAIAESDSADEATASNGGLNEDADRDAIDGAISNWLFDSATAIGDATVVDYRDDSGNIVGYQVIFADSYGSIRWEKQASDALRSTDYNAWYEEVQANYPAELTDKGKASIK